MSSAMRAKAIPFVIAALFASIASGQTPGEQNLDRMFSIAHAETLQDFQQVVRSVHG